MPGGIGAVSESVQVASAGRRRLVPATASANEIFFHLDARKVYLDRAAGLLYFVDSPASLITTTVATVLQGMGGPARFEQLHLDSHGLFNAARRIRLAAVQVQPVLIALRMAGVEATIR